MPISIPDSLIAEMDDATADILRTLRDYEPEPTVDKTIWLTQDALKAAGFGPARSLYPLPEELSRAQRSLVEWLAHQDAIERFGGCGLPSEPWMLRQWLGLEGGGILERTFTVEGPDGIVRTEVLWRALQRTQLARGDLLADVVDVLALTTLQRLEVFTQVYFRAYDLVVPGFPYREWVDPDAIDASCGAWALATAARLVRHHHIDATMKVPILVGLLRSGSHLDPSPEWDALMFADPERIPLVLECLELFPEDRRDRILARAIDHDMSFAHQVVRCGLAVLQARPSAEVAELVVAHAEKASRAAKSKRVTKTELAKAMKSVAAAHPGVAEVWERHLAGIPAPITLEVVSATAIDATDTLSAARREQLEVFGDIYDGHDVTLEARLEADPDEEWSFRGLQVRTLRNAATGQVYQAVLLGPDSGSVFLGDTIDEVAGLVQGDIECDDPALRTALHEVLTS